MERCKGKNVNIKWDTDGDLETLRELPVDMKIPEGMDAETASDYLSEMTGYCHFGFSIEGE